MRECTYTCTAKNDVDIGHSDLEIREFKPVQLRNMLLFGLRTVTLDLEMRECSPAWLRMILILHIQTWR